MTTMPERDARRRRGLLVLVLLLVVVDVVVIALVLRGRSSDSLDVAGERYLPPVAADPVSPDDGTAPAPLPAPTTTPGATPTPEGTTSPGATAFPSGGALPSGVPQPPPSPSPTAIGGFDDPVLAVAETIAGPVVVQPPGDGCPGHQVWRYNSVLERWQRPGCLPNAGLPAQAAAAVDFSSRTEGVVTLRDRSGEVAVFRTTDGGITWTRD